MIDYPCAGCGAATARAAVRCAACHAARSKAETLRFPGHCIDCRAALATGYRCAVCAARIVTEMRRAWNRQAARERTEG